MRIYMQLILLFEYSVNKQILIRVFGNSLENYSQPYVLQIVTYTTAEKGMEHKGEQK